MLDNQFHGQGYAREALEAMVQWAFADDYVLAVVAQTHEHNPLLPQAVSGGVRAFLSMAQHYPCTRRQNKEQN